jgi:hypothetical protein
MVRRLTRVKHFRPPKPKGNWPEPPELDGEPPFNGDEVHHPTKGPGRFGYCDWVDDSGAWVDPTLRAVGTRRDTTHGHWEAVVTTPSGGYRCPIDELTRLATTEGRTHAP